MNRRGFFGVVAAGFGGLFLMNDTMENNEQVVTKDGYTLKKMADTGNWIAHGRHQRTNSLISSGPYKSSSDAHWDIMTLCTS